MKKYLKFLGLFLVLSLSIMGQAGCPGCGGGSNTAAIVGQVVNALNNQPIEGATVSVQGTGLSARTDSQGQYQIKNVPTGQKTVIASKADYNSQSKTVNVVAGQTIILNFQLQPQTPLTGRIVFTSDRTGNYEIYMMNADGSNITRLTYTSANEESPRFSRDGSKIVFVRNGDIYVMNANGSNVTRLTYTSALEADPCFSPDGSKIVFTSNRTGNWELYIMNADGTNQTQLYSQGDAKCPCFSSDGVKILFQGLNWYAQWDIYTIDVSGSYLIRITNNPADDRRPCFSPDDTKIAFTSNRDGNNEIYIMNRNGSNQTRLTYDSEDDDYPCFSPDGTKIAFVRYGEIYVMNIDGSNQINITNNWANDRSPSWGP